MTLKPKRRLLILAIILLVIAIIFLVYSLVPTEMVKQVFPVTPTYFSPPVVTP